MKWHPLCIPCTVRAAYDIATKATDSEEKHKMVVLETVKWLGNCSNLAGMTPAMLHTYVFRLVQRITGNNDPFAKLKRESNRVAVDLIQLLERSFPKKDFKEAFRFAVLGAICGNSIDFEVEGYRVSLGNLERPLAGCLKEGLTIDDTCKLMNALSKAKVILYLMDNAGEIAFDKSLIKTITENYSVKVTGVVKSAPILNDATMEDALQVGLDEVAEVVTTGSSSIGLNLKECSSDFLRRLKGADLIIAKGQGYYESLPEAAHIIQKPVVYMLRAKCPAVAKTLRVPQGANVAKLVEWTRPLLSP